MRGAKPAAQRMVIVGGKNMLDAAAREAHDVAVLRRLDLMETTLAETLDPQARVEFRAKADAIWSANKGEDAPEKVST